MKNKASVFIKHVLSVLSAIAKAKTKTSATKARFLMLSTMKMSKKFLIDSIPQKINQILGHPDHDQQTNHQDYDVGHDQNKAIVLYNVANANKSYLYSSQSVEAADHDQEEFDDKYPDLTHSLFDEDDYDEIQAGGSVIEMMRNSKEEGGEEFILEDEIDHAADLFITRFHKQMRMQKLQSFKRLKEMLERRV